MDFQFIFNDKMYFHNRNEEIDKCENIKSFKSKLISAKKFSNNNISNNNQNNNENYLWNLNSLSEHNNINNNNNNNNNLLSSSYNMYLEQHQSNLEYFIKTSNLFYSNTLNMFLARFSGRRRRQCFHPIFKTLISNFVCLLVIISLFAVSEACSSRAVPKPRPSPTPTPRPNITFHTYTCPPFYDKWYCINGATCFTVQIGDEVLYNCECADGFMGPRCEFKELDGSYLPIRPRALLETASIASGATLALIFVIILCLTLYYRWQKRKKLNNLSSNSGIGSDEIDGIPSQVQCEHHGLRPFGPHHYQTLAMTATVIR